MHIVLDCIADNELNSLIYSSQAWAKLLFFSSTVFAQTLKIYILYGLWLYI